MLKFGDQSLQKLSKAHDDLRVVAEIALKLDVMDFSVIETHRGQAKQDRYYQMGKSKVQWPNGKHNTLPSEAMDLAPYVNGKISWDKNHCLVLAGVVLASAAVVGVNIRWGGNWDMDGEPITDQSFQDLVHYERVVTL